MDFLFWIDLKNKFGINHIVTILGPILNVGQPLILYAIKYFYYRPNINIFSLKDGNLPVALLNLAYLIYFINMYIKFLTNENENKNKNKKVITSVSKTTGHLEWPWLKYSKPYYYLLLFAINIFYLTNFSYSFVFFIITYFFLFLSVKYFYYSAGELWCFFGSFIPLFVYLIYL
jgi:hypothetical protein